MGLWICSVEFDDSGSARIVAKAGEAVVTLDVIGTDNVWHALWHQVESAALARVREQIEATDGR